MNDCIVARGAIPDDVAAALHKIEEARKSLGKLEQQLKGTKAVVDT